MFGRPEEFKEKLAHFYEDAYIGNDFVRLKFDKVCLFIYLL